MGIETKILVLIAMVFCHICDDYYLQGILASMKQRSWWQTNAPGDLYKCDYIMALLMHAISWSFMILIPVLVAGGWNATRSILVSFLLNAVVHAAVDDLKANRRIINLIEDQGIHIIQIVATWAVTV